MSERKHVWVVEQWDDGEWEPQDESCSIARKYARNYIRAVRSIYSKSKFRIRRYVREEANE
jgi:hypothetical protein